MHSSPKTPLCRALRRPQKASWLTSASTQLDSRGRPQGAPRRTTARLEEMGAELPISSHRATSTGRPTSSSPKASPALSGPGLSGYAQNRSPRARAPRRPRRKRKAYQRLESDELTEATAKFIDREDWDLFVTLTSRVSFAAETWGKKYRKFIRIIENDEAGLALKKRPLWREQERIKYVCAWEPQKRGATHLHILMSAPNLKKVKRNWMKEK